MDSIKKFQELLKELFQFETADLDFGIYRILNYKRGQIKKFIEQDLVKRVEKTFSKHKDARLSNITQKLEEAKKKVIDQLNPDVFTASGELKEEFKNTNVGKDYLVIKAQKDEVEKIDEIKLQVFNDLYSFFSRYYEEGDIVPKHRYSIKNYKYAIPYNGEEVKLYWANGDQYYTKTGYLFRDYSFFSDEATKVYKIVFRTVSAKEEIGSNKATKERFFILDEEKSFELDNKTLIIRLQYRELDAQEVKKFDISGGSNVSKQEKINLETFNQFIKNVSDVTLKGFLTKDYKNEKSLLLYQLQRFTAKNTKDFFIHKNLKKFLSEQLDYFLKSEVLSIETIEKEQFLDKHVTRAKVVREIGEDIIDFLAQIEDFQKKLWEKKKFVLKTEYVITTDQVPENFYEEIFENKEQKKEWKELGFELPKKQQELKNRKLAIDTKYFKQEFKEKLLEQLTEKAVLNDLLDGILIKSENWQALNLILNKYKEKIQAIYIDPPYNTGSDEFLYRDSYRHSSWLTMIENRLELARDLMKGNGVIFANIANNANVYKEFYRLGLLMDNLFDKRFADLIWKRRSASGSYVITDITEIHEYILCYGRSNASIFMNILSPKKMKEYINKDNKGIFKWHDLVIHQYTKEQRPNLFYGVVYNFVKDKLDFEKSEKEINETEEIAIYPSPDGKSVFTMTKESMKEVYKRSVIGVIKEGNNYKIKIKKYLYDQSGVIIGDPLKSILDDNETPWEIKGTAQATKELKELLGISFDTGKPINLIKLLAYVSSLRNDLILDFFAGSGTTAHAVMKLNKEDGGKRKFILVEMANYFDTVIIPRIKKVAYSFNWKDVKPQDTDGIDGFFKYHYLEQYEDTLDNIELTSSKEAELKFGENYLLKYFLNFETQENLSLLNIDLLKRPFSYKLKANLEEAREPLLMDVDLVETFNYLLGLKINKYKTRELNGKKYVFVLGEKQSKNVAIVWREYEENWSKGDFKKDKELIVQELESWAPHIVYINGQSNLTPQLGKYNVEIRYIEPEFKSLMG